MSEQDYHVIVKKDGKFYMGYCLEMPQALGQGDTKKEAVEDTIEAIKLCQICPEIKEKDSTPELVTVSI